MLAGAQPLQREAVAEVVEHHRAHARISRDSVRCLKTVGLDDGEDGIRTGGTICLTPRDGLLTVY
jgi:hypothetical protein